jgi:hypothetical protein
MSIKIKITNIPRIKDKKGKDISVTGRGGP